MIKLNKKNIVKSSNYIILSILGIFSYIYSIFWSNFAEVNIQFPFLNFPIFIGEFLLGFCLIGFFIKHKFAQIELKVWHYFLFFYIAFVLFKAFYGNSKWGPLAFRNAALFYYPLFVIIGYYFYESDFFKNKFVRYGLLALLVSTVFFERAYKSYYFTYLMLALVFFIGIKNKVLKTVSIILFLSFCRRGILFTIWASRNSLVSSFFSYIFLSIITAVYFVFNKLRRLHKTLVILFIILAVSLSIWHFSVAERAIKSLTKLGPLLTEYRRRSEIIEAKKDNFKFSAPAVKVYEKNKENLFDKLIDTILKRIFRPSVMIDSLFLVKAEAKPIAKAGIKPLIRKGIKPIAKAETPLKSITGPQLFNKNMMAVSLKVKNKEELIKITEGNRLQPIVNDEVQAIVQTETNAKPIPQERGDAMLQNNILYRMFISRDMLKELFENNVIIGIDFGKPFRSKSIDILGWDGSWKTRVGWVEPHNGYVHILYRSGMFGLLLISAVIILFINMVRIFIKTRCIEGVFLTSALLHWLIVANFMVILELPHFAIPFWSLFGLTLRYSHFKAGSIRFQEKLLKKAQGKN